MKGVSWPDDLAERFAPLWLTPEMTAAEVAEELGVTLDAARSQARKLGLLKPKKVYEQVRYKVSGSVAELQLKGSGGGHIALVDEADLDLVRSLPGGWIAHRESSGTVYVYSRQRHGSSKTVRLHRYLLNAPVGYVVDHVNGDGLDNRRCNIRVATQQQNCWNTRAKGPSGYVGVYFAKHANMWTGKVSRHDGSRESIGYFKCPAEAAAARDAVVRELRGDFARLNFPSGDLNAA